MIYKDYTHFSKHICRRKQVIKLKDFERVNMKWIDCTLIRRKRKIGEPIVNNLTPNLTPGLIIERLYEKRKTYLHTFY